MGLTVSRLLCCLRSCSCPRLQRRLRVQVARVHNTFVNGSICMVPSDSCLTREVQIHRQRALIAFRDAPTLAEKKNGDLCLSTISAASLCFCLWLSRIASCCGLARPF